MHAQIKVTVYGGIKVQGRLAEWHSREGQASHRWAATEASIPGAKCWGGGGGEAAWAWLALKGDSWGSRRKEQVLSHRVSWQAGLEPSGAPNKSKQMPEPFDGPSLPRIVQRRQQRRRHLAESSWASAQWPAHQSRAEVQARGEPTCWRCAARPGADKVKAFGASTVTGVWD